MMPLTLVAPGEEVRLVAVHGGHQIRQRLADLGLTPGVCLHVIQSSFSGPLIVGLRNDSRLVLGRGMAHHMYVEPLPVKPAA
jgi:ferrous iron transport protein A